MKRRGFTLIELLAVIVILAVIALITTPIILNMVEQSKKKAAEVSALNYVEAVETTMALRLMDNNITNYVGIYKVSNSTIIKENTEEIEEQNLNKVANVIEENIETLATEETKLEIKIKGDVPKDGTLTIGNNGKVTEALLNINKYSVVYDGTSGEVEVQKLSNSEDLSKVEKRLNDLESSLKEANDKIDQLSKTQGIQEEVIFNGTATTTIIYNLSKSYKNYKYLIVYADSTKHINVPGWTTSAAATLIIYVDDIRTTPGDISNYVISQYWNDGWKYLIGFTFVSNTTFRIEEVYSAGWSAPRINKIVGVK